MDATNFYTIKLSERPHRSKELLLALLLALLLSRLEVSIIELVGFDAADVHLYM